MVSKVFMTLGNDRPQVLIDLEDQVLQAVIYLSQGKSRGDVMDTLHSQIAMLVKDLKNDEIAQNWFDCSTAPASISSNPPGSESPSTPLRPGRQLYFDSFLHLKKTIQRQRIV
jgi:hypothetical protein